MLDALRRVMMRDLETLHREVGLYPDDASLWKEVPGLRNAGGNLALHLVGNLRHFIGAAFGCTGYARQRDLEFSTRGMSRAEVQGLIEAAQQEVAKGLACIEPGRLADPFPMEVGGIHPRTDLFLIHLAGHLAFHLGQIDYHRRAATGDPTGAGAVSVPELMRETP